MSSGRLGFREGSPAIRAHLDRIVESVLDGYRVALDEREPSSAAARLRAVEPEYRGFAFEGAGIYFWLLDALVPFGHRDRVARFVTDGAAPHVYMVYAGVGWAMARMPFSVESGLRRLDPILGWLAVDGYGFHQGFFHRRRSFEERRIPRRLRGYARRAFDQGLGRCLWFVEAADPEAIGAVIGRFPPSRQGDLWSGLGLACCYAGGVDRETVEAVRSAAAGYRAELAQGAAFAVQARRRGGNDTPYTALACEVLTGRPVAAVEEINDRAGESLPPDTPDATVPAYEVWRRRIQAELTSGGTG